MKRYAAVKPVSGRALARLLGVSEGAVRKAWKSGRITRRPDGKFDPEQVRAEWERNTAPRPGVPARGRRKQARVEPLGDHEERPAFYRGMAFLATQIRDPARVEALAEIARESGIPDPLALNLARAFVYVVNAWAGNYFLDTLGESLPGPAKFAADLKGWLAANCFVAEEDRVGGELEL